MNQTRMLVPFTISTLSCGKNFVLYRFIKVSNSLHRTACMSFCEHAAAQPSIVKMHKEADKEMQVAALAKDKEVLPSMNKPATDLVPEPIDQIPGKVRHLLDSRIIYSSLLHENYLKPSALKFDLRDKHILLVKAKKKREAVSIIAESSVQSSEALRMPTQEPEQIIESFPYVRQEAILPSNKKQYLEYFKRNKINYEALQEVDRRKELSDLLSEYDLGNIKPIKLEKSLDDTRVSSKNQYPIQETPQLQETPRNDPSMYSHTSSQDISSHTDDTNKAWSHAALVADVNMQGAGVCSVCKTILDLPHASRKASFCVAENVPASSDSKEQLEQLCQSCSFDAAHSSKTQILAPRDSYLDVMRPMSTRYSLVLLMVDVMDAPCSIHPNIMEIIGRGQPVIVVANKVDLLPLDGNHSLRVIWHTLTEMLKNSCLPSANIVDTVLVSARTGFGISELRTLLHAQWRDNGDIFLVGGAGCGKTTLFKALIDSMSADEHISLASRAKPYSWPLTKLELLKFEMKRTHGELSSLERGDLVERTVRPFKHLPKPVSARPFIPSRPPATAPDQDMPLFAPHAAARMLQGPADGSNRITASEGSSLTPVAVNEAREADIVERAQGKSDKITSWLFDTPSAVMPMQVLDLLTQEEIKSLTPRIKIIPQTFRLMTGRSLFLAGMARIDVLYLHHPIPQDIGWMPHDNAKLTVYAAQSVPKTIVRTVEASSFYRDLIGDDLLLVPRGSSQRLDKWPALAPQNFTVTGPKDGLAAADIVFPSLGFVSVWLHPVTVCSLRVWTPDGRGAFLRPKSLLPLAIHLKGKKQKGGLLYEDHVQYEEFLSDWDPRKALSPDRLDDTEFRSTSVKIRDKLGYQPKGLLK